MQLLLIAHPDDECMFFTPSIASKKNWHLMCMSAPSKTRLNELNQSCRQLGIKNVNFPSKLFTDGHAQSWDKDAIATQVREYCESNGIETIYTFDEDGVSGHPNHCALNSACKLLKRDFNIKILKTIPLPAKYLSVLAIPFVYFSCDADDEIILCNWGEWWSGIQAMMKHKSQLLWFRYLWLSFSVYTFCNVIGSM